MMLSRAFVVRTNSAAARAFFATQAPNVHNSTGATSLWAHEPPSAAQKKALEREHVQLQQSQIIDSSPQARAAEPYASRQVIDAAYAENGQRAQLERVLEFHGIFANGPKRSLVESLMAWRATL